MSLTRGKRLKAAAIAAVAMPVVEALGATYAWRERGAQHLAHAARDGRQPILAVWHGRILGGMLYFRDRGLVAIASENFDGEWIARSFTVRLRHGQGLVFAWRRTRARAASARSRRGRPVVFTVDGPRGPARVAQPGALWLAGATRNPIVPFHVEARSFWTVNSWDRHPRFRNPEPTWRSRLVSRSMSSGQMRTSSKARGSLSSAISSALETDAKRLLTPELT